jgi:hypothetical protein
MLMSIRCAYESCDVDFDKKTHNQKYCSDECCRRATNERIMRRYYEKRDSRQGKTVRMCKGRDCDIKLSRYNETDYCGGCSQLRKPSHSKLLKVIYKK